jgi:hypothetical protein
LNTRVTTNERLTRYDAVVLTHGPNTRVTANKRPTRLYVKHMQVRKCLPIVPIAGFSKSDWSKGCSRSFARLVA